MLSVCNQMMRIVCPLTLYVLVISTCKVRRLCLLLQKAIGIHHVRGFLGDPLAVYSALTVFVQLPGGWLVLIQF